MRWSAILAPLRHSHSASLSSANLNLCNKASFSTVPRSISPQKGSADTRLAFQEQARSSSQTFAIAKSGKAPSAHVTEVGNASYRQAKTEPIRSSTKTISDDKDSSGQGASSQTTVRHSKTTEEKARSSTSEAFKREAGRREALSQVNIKPLKVFPSSAQVNVSERHAYEANAASSNHAKGGFVINGAKDSTSAANQRNGGEAQVKVAGKINHPDYGITSARTPKISPSQTEGKAKPSVSPYESLSKNACTRQVGERSVGGVPGALSKRVGHDSLLAEDDASVGAGILSVDISDSSSSTNDTSECLLANGTSVHPEGSATLEVKNQDGFKKPSFEISFPVRIFADWWYSCFVRAKRPYYTTLSHPLNKVYVWLAAYQRVHFDATGNHIDGQSATILMEQLLNLQNSVLDGKFRWRDEKLVYLPMPVGRNEEPLSDVTTFPSFQDRVVSEILYLVLEPIFESRFSARSHGFRPGRDAHTALRAAQRSFQGCTWFISGNLSSLHEEIYATHLVDSVLRVVRDGRVTFLLKSGFLGGMSEQKGSTCACMFADQGSCSKLRNLVCNAFLDQLDWFMDEQISSLVKREQPSAQSPSNLLFKPERVRVERPRKLEYLRYGTEILVACNGTREEAVLVEKSIKNFLKQKFSMDFGNSLTINHISDGVKFLDHIISQKVVHTIVSRRRGSNGRVFEKRAHKIRLCIKAARECCLMYLKEIKTPTSSQHIEEMLLVLDNWYHYAENKEQVMQYCKWKLCYLYAKYVIGKKKEGLMDFAEQFKEAMRMVVYDQTKSGGADKANLIQDFFWIPEHEFFFREHAWLQSKSLMTEVAASFKTVRKVSPQQYMSEVSWQYLGGANCDNSSESEVQMQTSSWGQEFMVDTKLEDFAESVG